MVERLEANLTAKVNKWMASKVLRSCPWEIKHTRGKDSFAMRELRQHQLDYLEAATTPKGCTWKIPDTGIGYAPFDTIHYKNNVAFVVIVYPEIVVAIHIWDILEVHTPSLHVDDAVKLSEFHTSLPLDS